MKLMRLKYTEVNKVHTYSFVKKIFGIGFISIVCQIGVIAQKPKPLNDATYDDRPVHFGFTLGFNTTNYSIVPSRIPGDTLIFADMVNMQPGFHVSAIASFKIFEQLRFRVLPGFSFSERVIKYYQIDYQGDENIFLDELTKESAYIDVPFLLKYKALRINNFAPFILGGISVRYDLMASKTYTWENNQDYYLKSKPFDVAYEAGLGFDFYLPYFKFSTEFKVSMGMLDILVHETTSGNLATTTIDQLKSSMFMVSFHFE